MKYKMICCDLDDTLLNSERSYSPALKESVARYVDAGGKFVIVTGRMTAGAIPIAKDLGLHGEILTFQSAVIADIDTGVIIDSKIINSKDAAEVCAYLESRGYYFHTYVDDYFITRAANEFTRMYSVISLAGYKETVIPVSEYLLKNDISVPKILICEKEEKIPAILREVQGIFSDRFLVNTSKPWLVEIVPKEINKGVGVKRLAEKYNIGREEIICIGDSNNDIEMLKAAGLAVVVENGFPDAKKFADVIAPSSDDNGVGWVIENLAMSSNK